MRRWLAPSVVLFVAVLGAHPFCNAMFHCGCTLFGLTAHCNIHALSPPHCPWCAHPAWFALAGALALIGAALAIALTWRRTTALWPSIATGLAGAAAGAYAGALITRFAL